MAAFQTLLGIGASKTHQSMTALRHPETTG
jgi:hypothetical protein